jgi:hypothetical protein
MRDARRIVAITVLLTFVSCSNGSDSPGVGAAFARRPVSTEAHAAMSAKPLVVNIWSRSRRNQAVLDGTLVTP